MAATPAAAPPAPAAAPAAAAASPSLYVGDLDPKVTEAMLYDHFRVIGPVISVRVCIDSQTHKSLGYGYVNFQNPADAERAIDQMNGSKLADRACRVSRIQRDPTQRKSGLTNVVVKNIPQNMENTALKELFGKFGRIVSIKIPITEDGQNRGYAYVMFEKEDSARQAVEEMNEVEFGEAKLSVERYRNLAAAREEAQKHFTNLYVKNLNRDTTDEALTKVFEEFGKITSAKVRADDSGNGMGFGFVAFEDHDAAVKAIESYNDKSDSSLAAEGQSLQVRRFMDKRERTRAREQAYRERQAQYAKYPNLYVKNFDDDVTEERLRDIFQVYGETVSVRIQHDPFTKLSRGFGFVSFKEHGAAEKALRELAGSRALGARPLFVTYALRRDARRQQYEDMQKKRTGGPRMGGMGMMGGPGGMMGGPGGMMGGPGGMGGQNGMFGMQNPGLRMMNPVQNMMMRPGGMQGPMGMPNQMPMQQNMQMNMMPNRPMPQPPVRPPAAAPKAPGHPSGIDATFLASMAPEQQKNVLGERLYTYIVKRFPKQAAKITGMLLEMDNGEILNLLDSPGQLDSKMNEAIEVLERHDNRM